MSKPFETVGYHGAYFQLLKHSFKILHDPLTYPRLPVFFLDLSSPLDQMILSAARLAGTFAELSITSHEPGGIHENVLPI